jgi:hypothetical protein
MITLLKEIRHNALLWLLAFVPRREGTARSAHAASQGVLYSQSSEKLARSGSSALSGAEQLTVLLGKESVALASYFSLEAKLPTAG